MKDEHESFTSLHFRNWRSWLERPGGPASRSVPWNFFLLRNPKLLSESYLHSEAQMELMALIFGYKEVRTLSTCIL
jgi:hypothetical protein